MSLYAPYPQTLCKTMKLQQPYRRGFTIVELLIVIVVIAILAAISIVAYNGIQQRAYYSVMQQDVASVNKAILMYYADNGHYPCNMDATISTAYTGEIMPVPELVPDYVSTMPKIPTRANGDYYAYICSKGGLNYKLVRLVTSGTVPSVELSNPGIDPLRGKRGWGVWSSGGASL